MSHHKNNQRILVIKHGAFGDLIHATGALKALRKFYDQGHITLLTDPQFSHFTRQIPYIDAITFDRRTKSPFDLLKLRRYLMENHFDFVYDFQVTSRSNFYYKLFWPHTPPLWSGSVRGCSHYIGHPRFDRIHVQDRLQRQLMEAGVLKIPSKTSASFSLPPTSSLSMSSSPSPSSIPETLLAPDIRWLSKGKLPFPCPDPFVLIVPGCSKKHPQKRWPLKHYKELILKIINKGLRVILIGAEDEKDVLKSLSEIHPAVCYHQRVFEFSEIADLARQAVAAVGNDTGPTHLIAATQCPTFYCWSGASQPSVFAPRGSHVKILFEKNLNDLTPCTVWKHMQL